MTDIAKYFQLRQKLIDLLYQYDEETIMGSEAMEKIREMLE